jgi:hypothetical protein
MDKSETQRALEALTTDQPGAISMKDYISKPAPTAFTWDDARDIAIIFRDGFLMIVKGLERKFGLGKKADSNNSQQS